MNIFDRRHETLSRADLDQLHLERLQALLARLRRHVPRYRRLLGDAAVASAADLARLPLTSPEDLAAAFPYGLFALPLREVIRLHSAVGPGGMQLVIGHTRNDLARWARLAARQLVAAGASAQDVIQIAFSGGTFGQALGYLLGAELIEASVIPQDTSQAEYQVAMIQSYRPSVLIATPAQAREMAAALDARGIDPPSLQLRTVLLSRPVGAEERDAIARGLCAVVRCGFGLAEVLDPGFCVECPEGRLHVNEDEFAVEIVDGELVVTTLTREAMPLLRYRTRVSAGLDRSPCPCGRTGVAVRPGERLDGRLRVGEMPLYRGQVGALLAETRARGQPFMVDISEREVQIAIKVTPELFPDTVREMENLKTEIEAKFFAHLGIRASVVYREPREFGDAR